MDSRGNFTLEIVVTGIIIVLILGMISFALEASGDKLSKSVENQNIEKIISESCDNLINNPGIPQNWEDFKAKRVGLAIVNGEDNVVPNSVSYYKLVELGKDYDRLVEKGLFDNNFKSSMELVPYKTSISSVKIGESSEATNSYSVNRLVKCDFFKKYAVCDFSLEGKCNHNHNQDKYSCSYFKIFKNNLKTLDYYLLFDESEVNSVKYSYDTTHYKSFGEGITAAKTVVNLNDDLKNTFSFNDSSSIVFVHLNKKDAKAVLVGVPKDFDKSKLSYDYFITQPCNFIIKAWR